MRPIKFRAWDRDNKVMLENTFGIEGLSLENRECCNAMQFTGLLDKNGKEIYEGDLIKHLDTGNVSEVCFEPQGWWAIDNGASLFMYNKSCEVVGNIYENPDLLK